MTILEALVQLRDDIKLWCINNFNAKLNKNLGTDEAGKILKIDEEGNVVTSEGGADGADGVSISSVTQTTTSSADSGSNVVTVTLSDGTKSTFTVKNGSKGSTGAKGDTGSIATGICSTASSTAEKAVTIDGITSLAEGTTIAVLFTYPADGDNLTLNVNNLGAKPMRYAHSTYGSAEAVRTWIQNEVFVFVYSDNTWYAAHGNYQISLSNGPSGSPLGLYVLPSYGAVDYSGNARLPKFLGAYLTQKDLTPSEKWTLGDSRSPATLIYNTSTSSYPAGFYGADGTLFFCPAGNNNASTGLSYYHTQTATAIANRDSDTLWVLGIGSKLGVRPDGYLYAKGARLNDPYFWGESTFCGNIAMLNSSGNKVFATAPPARSGCPVINFGQSASESVEDLYIGIMGFGSWNSDTTAFALDNGLLVTPGFGEPTYTLKGTWKDSSGTAVSSDARLKNSIEPFNEKHDILFDNLIPRTFKYNDGTSDRTHSGFIAQELQKAIEAAGLTTQDVAAFVEFRDEKNEVSELGIRYTEIVSMNTWQIQKLKARVVELETKVDALTESR